MAKRKANSESYFVVDRAYLKREAREGAKTFFAPLTGVYRAMKVKSKPARPVKAKA